MAGTVDYFLKFEGAKTVGDIQGESMDDSHRGEIDVLSWSFGETQGGTFGIGTGGGAGKVSMQDFNIMMHVNRATPMLFLACALGDHIDKATLTCRKAGGDALEYLIITMEGVLVSSYHTTGGSGEGVVPMDSFSLNFEKISFQYTPQQDTGGGGGSITKSWNLSANKQF